MFNGISLTPTVYGEFDVNQWRDALYDATGEAAMMGITERQANLLYMIQKSFIVDRRLSIVLARHMAGTDHGNGISVSSEMMRARLLSKELLDAEHTQVHRQMMNEKQFRGTSRAVEQPRVVARFGLVVLYAMLTGKDESLSELSNLDLEETGLNQHPRFPSLLIDYLESDEGLPFEWWLSLNGLDGVRDKLLD